MAEVPDNDDAVGEERPCQPHHGNRCVYVKRRGGNGVSRDGDEPGQTESSWWEPGRRAQRLVSVWGKTAAVATGDTSERLREDPEAERVWIRGSRFSRTEPGRKLNPFQHQGFWKNGYFKKNSTSLLLHDALMGSDTLETRTRTAGGVCLSGFPFRTGSTGSMFSRKRLLCWKKLQKY